MLLKNEMASSSYLRFDILSTKGVDGEGRGFCNFSVEMETGMCSRNTYEWERSNIHAISIYII